MPCSPRTLDWADLSASYMCLVPYPVPRQLLPAVIDYTSPLASIASHVVVVVVVVAFVVCRPARKLYANVGDSRCCLRATHKTAN